MSCSINLHYTWFLFSHSSNRNDFTFKMIYDLPLGEITTFLPFSKIRHQTQLTKNQCGEEEETSRSYNF